MSRDVIPSAAAIAAQVPGVRVAAELRPFDRLLDAFEAWWQSPDRRGAVLDNWQLGGLAAFERGWHDWAVDGLGINQAFRRWWHSDERADSFGEREYVSALIAYQQGWVERARQ